MCVEVISKAIAWTFVIVMATYALAALIELIRWLYYEIRFRR